MTKFYVEQGREEKWESSESGVFLLLLLKSSESRVYTDIISDLRALYGPF
jgi:hypothetical protein